MDDESDVYEDEVPSGKNEDSMFHKHLEFESYLQPNDKVFKYVWAILYPIYIVVLITARSSKGSFANLIAGLILNFAWLYAFLRLNNPVYALIIITVMHILAVDIVFRLFRAKKKWQAILMIFYLAWLTFAFYLNFAIVNNYYQQFDLI